MPCGRGREIALRAANFHSTHPSRAGRAGPQIGLERLAMAALASQGRPSGGDDHARVRLSEGRTPASHDGV